MQMEGGTWGQMLLGADGGVLMGTDVDGAGAKSSCPLLCRGFGERGVPTWLSTLTFFGKQFQSPTFQLILFVHLGLFIVSGLVAVLVWVYFSIPEVWCM